MVLAREKSREDRNRVNLLEDITNVVDRGGGATRGADCTVKRERLSSLTILPLFRCKMAL